MKTKHPSAKVANGLSRAAGYFAILLGTFIFFLYTYDLTVNPPGFFVDEATFAYNAYTLATTGAGEFGDRFPLFFPHFAAPYTIYGNPVHTYVLAGLFTIFPPSIWLARLLSALAGFSAGVLFGLLAFRVSGKRTIGAIVGFTALITPWFFEFSRWFSDASYYPLMLALFLLALYHAHLKPRWDWKDISSIGLTLGLLTYTYSIGRLLAPLLALGLICFAVNKRRFIDVLKTWLAYGVTLVPFVIFYFRHPNALSSRFTSLSYFSTETKLQGLLVRFLSRYFQDLSLIGLLTEGDVNARHHVPGATGSLLAATAVLSLIGFVMIVLHHRYNPWWRFILWGTFMAVIPGALTVDPFHTGRMIAYAGFLMVLMIPALQWLMAERGENAETCSLEHGFTPFQYRWQGARQKLKLAALVLLVVTTMAQATYFQVIFWREGENRRGAWHATYKDAYDVATKLPSRPIYLMDGKWMPNYVNALWYATLEGRSTAEFVHVRFGSQPPPGALVISSEEKCANCLILFDNNNFLVYTKL